ncbi:Excinuclease ABC subunit C [hydrothermal vent metagenome]|uniref:Excinuclease ABC subunit C n=1 Tax=hydrothermal vent metagenome TaxID=652676 RepID=A0A3B0R844_9ZZZZ
METPQQTGVEIIAGFVRQLPATPGVYRMMDETGNLLYVGKAKQLRKRVKSYTRLDGHARRIQRVITATRQMEFILTETETEALLLESNLIKRLKPRYNILLRDDKSFLHILIRKDHRSPQILKHRGRRKLRGEYFGPFANAGAVHRTLDTLQKAFLLRNCSDAMFESRTRPCMQFQIKRCAGPCTNEVLPEDYAELVAQATDFLRGKSTRLNEELNRQMSQAAELLDYERASDLRDRIRALAVITANQNINPAHVANADVIAIHLSGGVSCVRVFFYRNGQNWGERAYFPRHDKDQQPDEILEAFLGQFYENKTPPALILLNLPVPGEALLAEAFSSRAGRNVRILVPQRGEKVKLVQNAQTNARHALERHLAASASRRNQLSGVQKLFDLAQLPSRIETYDNSHVSGSHAIGGMIVAGPDGFEKAKYRKFNIKNKDLSPGDDFGMMQEVLTRRFSRLAKEIKAGEAEIPDLVLIDGGAGQLSAALNVVKELGLADKLTLVGIAKGQDRDAGREQFFMVGKPPFRLAHNDPILYFLQQLRDEAHRYAIGVHRRKRASALVKSPLDGIPGIGPIRKKALLAHFGSAKQASGASLADLQSVKGLSKQMAQHIYDWFHEQI